MSAGLTTILERLASQLGSLEARLTALEAGKVSTSSAHVRTTHTNVPDDFHPTTTKRKGKAKAKAKATAPPKAAPAPPTPSVAKHSPHCPYQARTFPMADKPDHHLIMVVVPTDAAAHVVGRSGKGLKQIHDISGARVAAFQVTTSPDERQVTIRGTDEQIGEALVVLGKRLARKRVHYPTKKKSEVPTSSSAAPPKPPARHKPSASSKSTFVLPLDPPHDSPSTSRIKEVPPTEEEPTHSGDDDDNPEPTVPSMQMASPPPIPTPVASLVAMGSPSTLSPEAWTPMEVDAVLGFAGPNAQRAIATMTDTERRRDYALRLVELGQIPHPSELSSGPAYESRRGLQTARRSGYRPPRSRGRGR